MATTYLSPLGNEQQNDANGAPLSGGKVFTYAAGTLTPIATYMDNAGAVAQANPIVLNTSGMPASPIWLPAGQAVKMVFTDANGVSSRPTVDNIVGINDPSGISIDQWVIYTGAPSYISATSFSVAGDQRNTFQVGRRVRTVNSGGVVYGSIASVAFSTVTTVTVRNDSGVLDAGLSQVSCGLVSATNSSVPSGRLLGVQVFTVNATYTPTPNTTSVVVEVQGGGGAGGGALATGAGQIAAGGGGGAGGYAKSLITSGFSGVAVTVGAAGVPASGAVGGNGLTSAFGALLTATGGAGGTVGSLVSGSVVSFVGGGAGGAGSSGNILVARGAPGSNSLYGTNAALSGAGGASVFGGGAPSVTGTSSGVAATSYGSGGSGGSLPASSSAAIGGGGAAGVVIVYEYA